MDEALELLQKVLQMLGRLRSLEAGIPHAEILFPALLLFGMLNCILGYRLLRFWMMLVGFAAGVLSSYLIIRRLDTYDWSRTTYLLALFIPGVVIAGIAFAFYRAGIFLMVSVLGICGSIYLIYPTSSAAFYLCLLIGVVLGLGALKYDRPVIIITTSLFGGILSGYSTARIFGLSEFPYGLAISAGMALVGMLFQFAINKLPQGKTGVSTEPLPDTASGQFRAKASPYRRGTDAGNKGSNWKGVYTGWEEDPEEKRRLRDDFYEDYFHGEDVFDRTTREIRELSGESDPPDIHLMAWNQKRRKR